MKEYPHTLRSLRRARAGLLHQNKLLIDRLARLEADNAAILSALRDMRERAEKAEQAEKFVRGKMMDEIAARDSARWEKAAAEKAVQDSERRAAIIGEERDRTLARVHELETEVGKAFPVVIGVGGFTVEVRRP